MKQLFISRLSTQGFALPTVMITSVVMLIVLVAGLTSVSSVSSSLRQQYITRLSKLAAESGAVMAKACIAKSGSSVTWTNANPLKPNTNCNGTETTSCPDGSTSSACYVLMSNNYRTYFTVSVIVSSNGSVTDIESKGTVQRARASNGSTAIQSTDSLKMRVRTQSQTY